MNNFYSPVRNRPRRQVEVAPGLAGSHRSGNTRAANGAMHVAGMRVAQVAMTIMFVFGMLPAAMAGTDCAASNATATGTRAIACGPDAKATGTGATAYGSKANAGVHGTAVGMNSQAASDATAVGVGAHASGTASTAVGDHATTSGSGALAAGYDAKAAQAGAALGNHAVAAVNGAAVGVQARAGADAAAMGERSNAKGVNSAAFGYQANAYSNHTVAIGDGAKAGNSASTMSSMDSIAVGTSAKATKTDSIAIGHGATASNAGSMALGAGSKTAAAHPTSSVVIRGKTYHFAGADPTSVVSVGAAGTKRQVTNVAAGQLKANSTDAVNGSQLYATNRAVNALGAQVSTNTSGISGLQTQVNSTNQNVNALGAQVSTNTSGISGLQTQVNSTNQTVNALGAQVNTNTSDISGVRNQINSIDEGHSGAFQVSADSTGPPTPTGNNSVAGGAGAAAAGNDGLALGNNSSASGNQGTAVGTSSTASGAASTAIGEGASATGDNSVALGAGSQASSDNTVSVGSSGHERKVSNVAAGTSSTDAVNVSQLQQVQKASVQYDTNSDGSTDYNSVTLNPDGNGPAVIHDVATGVADTDAVNVGQLNQKMNTAVSTANHYTDQRFSELQGNLDQVGNRANAGIASAIAAASIPQPYAPNQSSLGVGIGTFHGETGIAVGLSRITSNGHFIIKASVSSNTRGNFGAGVGAGIVW